MNNQASAVICPPCGKQSLAPEGFNPGVAVATKEGQNRNKVLWPLLPRLTAVLPPQGREMSKGFTLIELLVVVLIIGILAAVALPQYQLAVVKAEISSCLPVLKSMAAAQERYYLENGTYIHLDTDLDISVPEKCTPNIRTDYAGASYKASLLYCPNHNTSYEECYSNKDFQIDKYYQHTQYTNAGKQICTAITTLGIKICNSLNLN